MGQVDPDELDPDPFARTGVPIEAELPGGFDRGRPPSRPQVLVEPPIDLRQQDERDRDGEYGESDGVLDDNDEVTFYLDFEPNRPATLTLLWSTAAVPGGAPDNSAAAAPNPVRLTPDTETPYVELWAETDAFRIGLNAEGLDDTKLHQIGNYGRAAFSVVEFRGKRLTDITSAWSNVVVPVTNNTSPQSPFAGVVAPPSPFVSPPALSSRNDVNTTSFPEVPCRSRVP